ncbi:chromosome partition protein MukB [Vibrio sp. SS-MA-C1-2]|uniref:chromosome partition protein MukB n=1 Tax=Vibrio sp. SS-MA-C1-2 TaxID=2908646 RepID=UPI001F1F4701|nr:chromosome partition protein MukB [Vibrio sp. SS-MA-C1-2]UJF16932.1 chromosome partition protein MukB [Vibrio sp. SS-MA-C1-2]
MMERGKFHSMTMINWNGFFARTFDLDEMVTTLSGGNGAGKSTAMASFITALIPDQTLLHFRNTTEAGSSNASRDKGLHGKLKPGTCYSALEIVNSKNQRLVFAVKLQQIAGRDKKVEIKPIIIKGLPTAISVSELLIETQGNGQARVRPINELKEFALAIEGVQFTACNSVTDYHGEMFEYGVLPKKLRNQSDRGKYYRLIEASLFGGISSAITRSLRDYLLPQNGGVKKAFQDMEGALRENRMTLEAIKVTQSDRDLFKHLITEATHYVAADYMRNANERRKNLELTLQQRRELFSTQQQVEQQNKQSVMLREKLDEQKELEQQLEIDHQGASDHFQLVQSAVRQHQKITRYQEELEDLAEKLEEQVMIVEEASERLEESEQQGQYFEDEVDSLKSQLADYQQALDVQQTRALQYQQAVDVLNRAKASCQNPDLTVKQAEQQNKHLKEQQTALTSSLLSLQHQLDIASAATEQFEDALKLVCQISGENVDRQAAADTARQLIQQGQHFQEIVANKEQTQQQFNELQRRLRQQQQAKELSGDYHKLTHFVVDDELFLEERAALHQEQMEERQFQLEDQADQRLALSNHKQNLTTKITALEKATAPWFAANSALDLLEQQTTAVNIEADFDSTLSVTNAMQQVLDAERQVSQRRDQLAEKKGQLESEIERLAQPGGNSDPRLHALADTLGGVLLSEIYDDVTLEDAPYFSSLYGPARHAIVVSDLKGVKEKLVNLDDCPDDLYIIEGDLDAFDDNVFDADDLGDAVCVHLNDRQMRYSRFPKVPLFGTAAREMRLNDLREQREALIEDHASTAFESQKLQRLYQSYNQFVATHLSVVFDDDPEVGLKQARTELNNGTAKLNELTEQGIQLKSQLEQDKVAISLLNRLSPLVNTLQESNLATQLEESGNKVALLDKAVIFVQKHGKQVKALETCQHVLASDPQQFEQVKSDYQQIDQQLQSLKKQQFILADLYERRHHFDYQDSIELVNKSSELNEQLKVKLLAAEGQRTQSRAQRKQQQSQLNQYNQLLASLKSAHQAKQETLVEFQRELDDLGVRADIDSANRAEQRKEELYQQLSTLRTKRSDNEKQLTATELNIRSSIKQIKKLITAYQELRQQVVKAKAGWCAVLRLARDSDVERRLNRRDLAYKSADELRSMSDKSLGALRIAVANNERLRDALRASEDAARPERKILFYVEVYQHLRERIRQDIIQTDDPVEAIEEMEVELARLTHELTQREKRLAISSESVANIIRKTIQREQNRIRLLNQGLQNIVFGQVKGVRLNVNIRETHTQLLVGLSEQQELHQDLFNNDALTFSEAMAKLFQRINAHIDTGQRTAQTLGEELLDYRNYLELGIEVNRGTEGWLRAESGALSTGEAIGTGQAILLMVMQSWEEESRRLRSKDIIPCRLLFLDEAARLDAKSIATLFELCERLDMQLLIAAPENISPEKGTTYKLIRKIMKDREHVHVVGLKGFVSNNGEAANQQLPLEDIS